MRKIVLASTSPYRRRLLEQLQLEFTATAPEFVESIDSTVEPDVLVKQLAQGKAQSLVTRYPEALIIGSDQIFVDADGNMLGKSGCLDKAFQQLRRMAGQTHRFYTGLALVDARTGGCETECATFSVTLRSLSDRQILDYLKREQPFDCAGSFKIEGLGIALMEKMAGDDYNALIGLPLIRLTTMLERAGVALLGN